MGYSADHRDLSLDEVERYNASLPPTGKSEVKAQAVNRDDNDAAESHFHDIVGDAPESTFNDSINNATAIDAVGRATPNSTEISEQVNPPVVPTQATDDAAREHNPVHDMASTSGRKKATKTSKKVTTVTKVHQRRIRLYVTQNRLWLSLTGHGFEPTKIMALDFQCLLCIAASGPKGIDQQALVEITGQDVRSVPLRTDRLASDGYITKKPIFTYSRKKAGQHVHTSHMVLQRFVEQGANESVGPEKEEDVPLSVKKKRQNRVKRREIREKETQKRASDQLAKQKAQEDRPSMETPLVPQWTPYRSLSNQVLDIVEQSGLNGVDMGVSSCHTSYISHEN